MHTPQHTPGPWSPRIIKETPMNPRSLAVWQDRVQVGEIAEPICIITPQVSRTERDEANAALISAAPDMLALLQEIIANYQADRETSERYFRAQYPDSDFEYEYPEWYDRTEAAVQKATTLLTD